MGQLFTAGDDVVLEFTVTDEDDIVVDITGMSLRFAMARRVGSANVISTEDASATATITDAGNGVFQVEIASAETASLISTYVFEAEVEDTDGNKRKVDTGFITFRQALLT